MNKRLIYLLFFISVLMMAELAFADSLHYSLIYSGNLEGELEPCGCSIEGNSGGILRRAQKLDELRASEPALFALSAGGLLATGLAEETLKSRYIFKGFAQLGYDAVGVQWSDLLYGEEFATAEPIPWVASNWLGKDFVRSRTLERDGKRLVFFSWLDPQRSPYRQMHGEHRVITSAVEDLAAALQQARADGLLTVLASTYTLEQAQQELPLQYVDVLLIKAAYEEYAEPKRVGDTVVLQPGSRGLRLGRIEIDYVTGKGVIDWRHEVISLPPAVPNAKRLEAWYQAYNDEVAAAYQASVEQRKAQAAAADSPFAGEKACRACHLKTHEIFKQSRHAKAFSILERVNKAFDPECIVCHSVGFNTAGGFIDSSTTRHLRNVQCESCHGAGRAHAESAGQAPLAHRDWEPQQMCAQCHTPKHSPAFDFASYFAKIKHSEGQAVAADVDR